MNSLAEPDLVATPQSADFHTISSVPQRTAIQRVIIAAVDCDIVHFVVFFWAERN